MSVSKEYAPFLPSAVVNTILPYVETSQMRPLAKLMSWDKTDQNNFYKALCERLFPQIPRNGFSWEDHYHRCRVYKLGRKWTKKTVTFLKDSSLFAGRVLAPIAATALTSYFGERYFQANENRYDSGSNKPIWFNPKDCEDELSYIEKDGHFHAKYPRFYVRKDSAYTSISRWEFAPKSTDDRGRCIALFITTKSDSDYLSEIRDINRQLNHLLLVICNCIKQPEDLQAKALIKNYLKLALTLTGSIALASLFSGSSTNTIKDINELPSTLMGIFALTISSYVFDKTINLFLRDRWKNIVTNIVTIVTKAYVLAKLSLAHADKDSFSSFVMSKVLLGVCLAGGITSFPIATMAAVGLSSFLSIAFRPSHVSYALLSDQFSQIFYSSALTGCITTGILCSSTVTKLAKKVSNCVGDFFGHIVGSTLKIGTTAVIYGKSCFSYVSGLANRVYQYGRSFF